MSTFVLEIGTEELPARFLPVERKALKEGLAKALESVHLGYGQLAVFTTPRRATVLVEDLEAVQAESFEVVSGPPLSIAYDSSGAPSKALQGFLRTQGLTEADLFERKTEKGVYLAGKRKVGGLKAAQLLAEICPQVLNSLPFAKRMHWGDYSLSYARPVHWLLALLDQEVVPFSFGPLESGRQTFGHRVHGKGPFLVPSAQDYFAILEKEGQVTLADGERRALIMEQGQNLAQIVQGEILWKTALLEEVVGLVEHPVPILGSFDPSYLEVPEEVLLTSMESHQKSFGLRGQDGKLLPYFLTVLNLEPAEPDLVKKGWERVLHARLEDARFFWKEDLKCDFATWQARLEQVIFIGPLGSMGEKSERLAALGRWLVNELQLPEPGLAEIVERSGRLAKADLVSGMVGEFDTLQGIMGGIYAEKMGEDPKVASALKEQYLPQGPDSPLPKTLAGAILAICDKADTLAGCFGLNKIPTGTADPFALRRCALGIIRICEAFALPLHLPALLDKARALYGEKSFKLDPKESLAKLLEFFRARLSNYLQGLGYSAVLTEACLKAGALEIPDLLARIKALDFLAKEEDFVAKAQILKRIANILQKKDDTCQLKPELLTTNVEQALLAAEKKLEPLNSSQNYSEILATLAWLKPVVDDFFNGVMVLCEDQDLQGSRLALLAKIQAFYARVADFSALQL